MVANLPPQFHEKEAELKRARTPGERIAILEEMLTIMPKHKSSEKLQAEIKTKISRLRKAMEQPSATARRQTVPTVPREGAGQVILCGPPNTGKSSLLAALTKAEPGIADYPFTTKLPMPGMLPYRDIQIQLVDTPSLSREFAEPWLGDILRKGDLLLFVFDLASDLLLDELEDGLAVLEEFRVKEPGAFVFSPPMLWAGNKADAPGAPGIEQVFLDLYRDRVAEHLRVSAKERTGLEELAEAAFRHLGIVRVYTKSPGKPAAMESPYTIRRGSALIDLARHVHKDLAESFRYARLWRAGAVTIAGRETVLEDGDVVEIHG